MSASTRAQSSRVLRTARATVASTPSALLAQPQRGDHSGRGVQKQAQRVDQEGDQVQETVRLQGHVELATCRIVFVLSQKLTDLRVWMIETPLELEWKIKCRRRADEECRRKYGRDVYSAFRCANVQGSC